MTPLGVLKQAAAEFKRHNCRYCLIGGHAASLYRRTERVTRDVDFAIVGIPPEHSQNVAEEVLRGIGFEPVLGFIPGARDEKKPGELSLVTSAPADGELTGIIDILLPKLPWIADAVARAQSNKIDLGFARVPVIAPEDLIIAKCYALRSAPDRFQDLDDLKEIFTSTIQLDLDYVALKLEALGLTIPKVLRPAAPQPMKRLCR